MPYIDASPTIRAGGSLERAGPGEEGVQASRSNDMALCCHVLSRSHLP